ncbi:MAG: hypothetical protein BAA04_09445 [Firmicutes bacterium ZCTH02-B6]|nr:MAG: hypothetical protein BAA04_09445 [Firmicutes bacterium ZCTH02-B6]
MSTHEQERALMARAAWLYYHRGLTQQDIGERLGLSRVKVVRLLARAREEGIVQIRVDHPSLRFVELEEELRRTFGLKEAIVVPSGETEEQTREAIGRFGAIYLERALAPGDVIGTAWGVTLREVARHLRPLSLKDVTVVQLMGGLNAGGLINPLDIARAVADKLQGNLQMLYTPAFVDSARIRAALLSDHRVAQTLRAGASATKALVGIGDVSRESSLVRWGALTPAELDEAVHLGAVGDILGRHFDAHGRPIESPLAERVIGLTLESLRSIPQVIAFAGGGRKAAAILGALRARYVHVLITDEATARLVLAGQRA